MSTPGCRDALQGGIATPFWHFVFATQHNAVHTLTVAVMIHSEKPLSILLAAKKPPMVRARAPEKGERSQPCASLNAYERAEDM